MRQIIPINDGWHFIADHRTDYLELTYPMDQLPEVRLPHTMKETPFNHFDERITQFVGTYFHDFCVEKPHKDTAIVLRFYGVMASCIVYLNGVQIGTHQGGYTPFEYDITDLVVSNQHNRLLVVVDGHETPNIPPFGGVVDYLPYSGIYREVELCVRNKSHFQHLLIETSEMTPVQADSMILSFKAPIVMDKEMPNAQITIRLTDGAKLIGEQSYERVDPTGFHGHFSVSGIERWDLEHPKLYHVEICLYSGGQLIDEIKDRIGFRSILFTATGFFLNGKKRKLIGLDRHQSFPYVGYAMPRRMQERDAEILRQDLGCHLVRTSHYMQSDHFIRRADEIGLLVLEEIPGWQYIGNNQFKELSLANLKTMICHHFNHPSIVLWGVRINESPDDHAFYQETNRLARELDSSRPTTGIRNFRHSEFLEDVYSYNDFSHVGDNPGLIHPDRVAGKHAPYLVTEHNGHIFPTKKTDPEKKLVEQAIRHLTVMDAAYRFDRVSGAIGWCLADYNTHKEFGSSDRVCYHGVMDMYRIPKIAAMAYASQHLDVPVLEIASSNTPGEYDESRLPELIIFTNCDSVTIRLNERLIGTWYPDRKRFRHVPHPPIILPDLIGNRMETEERYSKAKTRQILKVLRSYFRHGLRMPLTDILRMVWLMLFRGFSTDEAYRLVGKYIINWGMEEVTYTFEGIRDNVKTITKTLGRSAERHLMMSVDDPILKPKDTYEVTRVVCRLEDGFGNTCRNAYDVISVQVGEGLEIIGPKQVALIGGSTAVYVRTTRKKGIVPITGHMEGIAPKSIQITIQ